MTFTVVLSDEDASPVYDRHGDLVAIDYTLTTTWDGTAVYQPLPSTAAMLQQLKNMTVGKALRLRHITAKTTDTIANKGRFAIYLGGNASATNAWGFTRVGTETLGLDLDFFVDINKRSYGNYGMAFFWFDAAPSNTAIDVHNLYFEVVRCRSTEYSTGTRFRLLRK